MRAPAYRVWLLLVGTFVVGAVADDLPELTTHDISIGAFEQRRHVADLDHTLVSSGRFVYHIDQGLLWQVHEPIESTLLIAPDGVFQDGEWVSAESAMASLRPVLLALFGGDLGPLGGHFEVRHRPADGGGWRLELEPGDGPLARFIESVDMTGDRHPVRMRIAARDGGHTELVLHDVDHPGTLSEDDREAFEHAR